jgi:hypothetical protein
MRITGNTTVSNLNEANARHLSEQGLPSTPAAFFSTETQRNTVESLFVKLPSEHIISSNLAFDTFFLVLQGWGLIPTAKEVAARCQC